MQIGWKPLILAVALLSPAAAHATERLTALSKTAMSITGDVVLSPTRIVFANRVALKLRQAASSVPFKGFVGDQVEAELYHVLTPEDPLLLRGNRLCGSGKPLTYLLVWRETRFPSDWTIALSTSDKPPEDTSGICATYTYRKL